MDFIPIDTTTSIDWEKHIYACSQCGCLIAPYLYIDGLTARERHMAFHESLRRTSDAAWHADAMMRPLGS